MLQLSYVGISFSVVFYVVFGIAVKLMELSDSTRNKARLFILSTSVGILSISSLIAGAIQLRMRAWFYGVTLLLLSLVSLNIIVSIIIEIHNIKTRVRMRRFMALFDIVERFTDEGKTKEEIMTYLTDIQKLTKKEASDFLEFISDPTNHQFLADVNSDIQRARLMR
ncbi:MAG: hypothetical protein K6G10_05985 [Butyrivibrio sp.]|nr:hypothetical protein [Butyrivibrio sp.]